MPVAKKITSPKKSKKTTVKKPKTSLKKVPVKKKVSVVKKQERVVNKQESVIENKESVIENKESLVEKEEDVTKKKKIPKVAKIEVRVIGGGIKPKDPSTPLRTGKEEIIEEVAEEAKDGTEEVLEEMVESGKEDGLKTLDALIDPAKNSEKEEEGEKKTISKSIGLYRRISLFFVFLTVVLLALVFYFSFVSLTIYVSPEEERISDKLIITVYNTGNKDVNFSSREYIKGAVEQVSVREENTYKTTGSKVVDTEIVGKVTILNNYNQSQALIATTRLLTADEKLFRIKDSINVPAGGEVEVEIYADEPSSEMAIGPTEFTIPGLWAGLQDKIYATSDEVFIYKTEVKKFVQQSDIDKSIQDLKSILLKNVEDTFAAGYKDYDKIIYSLDNNSIETEVRAGVDEEIDEFKIGISALVNIVGINRGMVEKLAEEKLVSVIPNNKKLTSFDGNKIEYNLGNYNFDVGVATIEATFSGIMALKEADSIINKERIVGLSEDQLRDYLVNLNIFKDFEIVFSPAFIKTAPTLVDRIKIEVKE